MSEPKFTPGPWTVRHRHCDKTQFDDESCGLGLDIEGPEEALNRGQFAKSADARLIAAAPDLYWALRQAAYVLADYEGQMGVDHTMIGVRKALAKVESNP